MVSLGFGLGGSIVDLEEVVRRLANFLISLRSFSSSNFGEVSFTSGNSGGRSRESGREARLWYQRRRPVARTAMAIAGRAMASVNSSGEAGKEGEGGSCGGGRSGGAPGSGGR